MVGAVILQCPSSSDCPRKSLRLLLNVRQLTDKIREFSAQKVKRRYLQRPGCDAGVVSREQGARPRPAASGFGSLEGLCT